VEFAKKEVVQTPEFVAREAIKSLNQTDLRSRLKDILVPSLVVVGDEDVITPTASPKCWRRESRTRSWQLSTKPGHFPMLEQPVVFNRTLEEFLARSEA
jgi:pimeloyl-ACP methyl ester carboxylesterase